MRTMWCVLWCVASTLIACAVGAPVEDNIALAPISRFTPHLERTPPDDEGGSYADPGAVRYERGTDAVSPWLYLLAEMPHESQMSELLSSGERRAREKRKMPSLSINNPMEVLRQRLMLEVARKQMREANQRQAFANRMFLQNVGKRGYWTNVIHSRDEN